MMKTKHALAITWMATTLMAAVVKGGNPELPVDLGTAGDFVILAAAGIATDPPSTIMGDMGVSPIAASAITGFALTMDGSGEFSTSAQVAGKIYASDYLDPTPAKMTLAITDMIGAFNDAAGRALPDTTEFMGGDISGQTMSPGLHKWSTGVLINTDVWLDAGGNPDAVFIFQISGDLTMASAQNVILSGGAQAKNIFWQVKGGVGAVIGTTAHFEGIILTEKAITLQTGATFNGKLLAQTRVDLQGNSVQDADLIVPPGETNLTLTVISKYGVGTPLAGLPPAGFIYYHDYGVTLTNSIMAVVPFGAGTQFVNVGWSLIGNEPAAGTTNAMVMTLTNSAVLTWLWSTNYLLNASAGPGGSVAGDANGFYAAGSTVVVTAVPGAGYHFAGWTGNVSGPTNAAVQTLTMNESKEVTALFSSNFIDVSSLVTWTVDWVCDPCKGYYIGTLRIANNNAPKSLTAPIWFEVQRTPQYWLRTPTGFDANTGMEYLDISTAVANKLVGIGDRDLMLDPGESVTITGIELIGDYAPTGLVVAVWADPPIETVVPENTVGVAFEMALPEAFAAAAQVTVSGVPAGLKYNATTRMITGVPTKVGAFDVVISAAGVPSQTIMIGIGMLPTWAQGVFNGYVEGGGLASMNVTARGKITGKLTFGGRNYTFKAASYAAGGTAAEGFSVETAVRVGRTPLTLTLHVSQAVDPAPQTLGVVVGQLGDGKPVVLYRDVWTEAGAELASRIGYYTASLPGNGEYGSGYLTFTVSPAGKVKVSGKLADGTRVSQSGALIMDGAGRVFTVLYAEPRTYQGGRLFGLAEFASPTAGHVIIRLLADPIVWTSLNPKATGDYGVGFSRELGVTGGWYDKLGNIYEYYRNRALSMHADAGAQAVGLGAGANRAGLALWDADGVTLTIMGQSVVPESTSGVKFSLAGRTGVFKGSFKSLPDDAAALLAKTVLFEGVLTPQREKDGVEGRGYFLWTDRTGPTLPVAPYAFKWSYDVKILSP